LDLTVVFPEIPTERDVRLFRLSSDQVLVVACDSAGAIGPKPLDRIRVYPEVVGRYTARVALMEAMSVNAWPFLVVCTLAVEPRPTANEIVRGVRGELRNAKLESRDMIMVSTEKNFPTRQTSVGITVISAASRRDLRIEKSRAGDVLVAVGLPFVGDDVVKEENKDKIVDLTDLRRLLRIGVVHDIVPVGSGGIEKEAKVIAKDSKLGLRLSRPRAIDLRKSAGPATVILCSVPESGYAQLSELMVKPVTRIGRLSNRLP
jgi:hypothetical protein